MFDESPIHKIAMFMFVQDVKYLMKQQGLDPENEYIFHLYVINTLEDFQSDNWTFNEMINYYYSLFLNFSNQLSFQLETKLNNDLMHKQQEEMYNINFPPLN